MTGVQTCALPISGLLVAEYRLHKDSDPTAPDYDAKQVKEQSNSLLTQRDRHIAARINSTLLSGESGLLFLGMSHSVEPLLNDDIEIKNILSALLMEKPQ